VTGLPTFFHLFSLFLCGETACTPFDTILDGHHPAYLTHLIGYYSTQPDVELIVATGEEFQTNFAKRQNTEQLLWGENVRFRPVDSATIQSLHASPIYLRSIREWNMLVDMANELQVSHALLMYVDYFPLGVLIGKKSPVPVSGISFRPPQKIQGLFAFIKQKLWQAMLSSGQIERVFSIVHSAVPFMNQISTYANVIPLADPVVHLPLTAQQKSDFRLNCDIAKNKKVFLNFGQLDRRKGIEAFVAACKLLSPKDLSGICLLLAGPIESSYAKELDVLFQEIPNLQVVKLYDYHNYPTVELCFDLADVVLVTYQDHLGMSSVLVRAALAGKPVIGTQVGTIGLTIKDYHLGLSIDPLDDAEFAEAIKSKIKADSQKQAELAHQNSVEAFVLTIAKGIES